MYSINSAVKLVSEMNAMIDYNGVPLVRKAIICSVLALNANSCKEIILLLQHLKDIIQHSQKEFAISAVQ